MRGMSTTVADSLHLITIYVHNNSPTQCLMSSLVATNVSTMNWVARCDRDERHRRAELGSSSSFVVSRVL